MIHIQASDSWHKEGPTPLPSEVHGAFDFSSVCHLNYNPVLSYRYLALTYVAFVSCLQYRKLGVNRGYYMLSKCGYR